MKNLKEILELHRKWLDGKKEGIKADLSNVNLSGADLRYADLRYANLTGVDLSNADLSDIKTNGWSEC